MTAMAQALSTALLHFVWQGVAVALILWIALFLLRRRSAQARYLAACAALAVLAAMPVITAWMAYAPSGVVVNDRQLTASASAVVSPEGAVPASPAANWVGTLKTWALPAWSLGVLLFSVRLVWGCRQVSLLRRRGEAANASLLATIAGLGARLGLYRPVRVLITSASDGPSVVGWLRPVILLPSATLLGLSTQQLEAVLAHELAHVRRYDYLVNLVQTLVETLLFYHPAVWWTSARIRHERELCCDDLAVRLCGDPVCYARALTRLERLRVMTPSLAMGSTGGSMLYRVQRLLGAGNREYGPSKISGILAFALALACLGLNLHWAHAQEPEPQNHKLYLFRSQVRDAAGVNVDLGNGAVLHRTSVPYPQAAIQKGIQGMVVVEATLDATGNVEDARVVSGPAELRRAALQSVLQWHFLPGRNGNTQQVSVQFQVAGAQAHETGEPESGVSYSIQGAAGPVSWTRVAARTPESNAEIETQLEELRARRAETLAVLERKEVSEAQYKAKAELAELESRITENEHKLAENGRVNHVSDGPETRARAEAETVEMLRRAREEDRLRAHNTGDRTLRQIELEGFSDAVRAQLASRLPVHLGDTLTAELVERLEKTIRSFDEHLEMNLTDGEDGAGAVLRIAAPNSGGFFTLRVK